MLNYRGGMALLCLLVMVGSCDYPTQEAGGLQQTRWALNGGSNGLPPSGLGAGPEGESSGLGAATGPCGLNSAATAAMLCSKIIKHCLDKEQGIVVSPYILAACTLSVCSSGFTALTPIRPDCVNTAFTCDALESCLTPDYAAWEPADWTAPGNNPWMPINYFQQESDCWEVCAFLVKNFDVHMTWEECIDQLCRGGEDNQGGGPPVVVVYEDVYEMD